MVELEVEPCFFFQKGGVKRWKCPRASEVWGMSLFLLFWFRSCKCGGCPVSGCRRVLLRTKLPMRRAYGKRKLSSEALLSLAR